MIPIRVRVLRVAGVCVTVAALAGLAAVHYGGNPLSAALAKSALCAAPSRISTSSRGKTTEMQVVHGPAIRPDLFSAPVPGGALASPPRPQSASSAAVTGAQIIPDDTLADYVYAGSVTLDGKTMALIERRATREGWYVAQGDTWQNTRIEAVAPGELTLLVNGKRRRLTKSDAFNSVPLLADARRAEPVPVPQEASVQQLAVSIDGAAVDQVEGGLIYLTNDPLLANDLLSNSITVSPTNINSDVIDLATAEITIQAQNSPPVQVDEFDMFLY